MAHTHKAHSFLRSSQVAHRCPAVPTCHLPVRTLIGQPASSYQLYRCMITCRAHDDAQNHVAAHSTALQPNPCHQQLHSVVQQVQRAPANSSKRRLSNRVRCQAADSAVSADIQAVTAQQCSSNGAGLQGTAQQRSTHQVIEVESESNRTPIQIDVEIKAASTPDEIQAVAKLRAEAYYAEDHSRFAQSFKKQFASQEVESLRQRTASSNGRPQLCECLVALQPDSGKVLGCIDIRLPRSATGMRAIGVPEGDDGGCYLLNVVVDEFKRGQGIGKALMRAAMARAVQVWKAERLYTHVEADNEVACGLYKGCGFREHSSEAKYADTVALGRLVLLVAVAADLPAVTGTSYLEETGDKL